MILQSKHFNQTISLYGGVFISKARRPLPQRIIFAHLSRFIDSYFEIGQWFTVNEITNNFNHRSQNNPLIARCLIIFEEEGWVKSDHTAHLKKYCRVARSPIAVEYETLYPPKPRYADQYRNDIISFCKTQTQCGGYITFDDVVTNLRDKGHDVKINAVTYVLSHWDGIKCVGDKLWRLTKM